MGGRIVVGAHASPAGLAALRWAADEGAARQLPVVAVLCWSFPERHGAGGPTEAGPAPRPSPALAAILGDALGPTWPGRVDTLEVLAHPAGGLRAAVGPDDLLVVGAGGTRMTRGLLAGAVSQQVLHRAPGPVALLHADAAPPPAGAPVVVGVDGSQPSLAALEWAVSAARDHGTGLRAIETWASAVPSRFDVIGPDELELLAEQSLAAALEGVEVADLAVTADVIEGEAADVLVAASRRAHLLAVGSHGFGNLSGLVLGSVAHRVAHLSACPVVLVPRAAAPPEDQGPLRPADAGRRLGRGET